MDPDISLPNIPNDILLPQAYVLNGYSRSLLRNPFHAANYMKKNHDTSIYESTGTPEKILDISMRKKESMIRPVSSHYDRLEINNAQQVFKIAQDFLEENGLCDQLLKPMVDLDDVYTENETNHAKDSIQEDPQSVRFEEDNHEQLHQKFMKQVNNILAHRQISRPNTSDSVTLYRPNTASTGRSFTHSIRNTRKIYEDNSQNLPQRPQSGSTVTNTRKDCRNSKTKTQLTDMEQSKMVIEFLEKTPLLSRYRLRGPKSLADWRMMRKAEEQIWDSGAFSVGDFMRDYVKGRDAERVNERDKNKKPPGNILDGNY